MDKGGRIERRSPEWGRTEGGRRDTGREGGMLVEEKQSKL